MEYRLLAVTANNRLENAFTDFDIDGVSVEFADSISQALQQLSKSRFRFIVLDFEGLGSEAIPFLKRLNRISPLTDIILFSNDSGFEGLVIDCIVDKSLPADEIHAQIVEAIDRRRLLDDAGMFGH